jgi:hypothetical protein
MRFFVRWLGRRLCWQSPLVYWAVGRLRRGRSCFERDFDLWIDGYPRSANTFCAQMFQLANPAARIRSHCHIPPFIIQALAYGKPGILLVRKPVDAACSWAIHQNCDLEPCLDYYIDFHHALRRHIPSLFIVSFEHTTSNFPGVVAAFNRRFGTNYLQLDHEHATVQECFAKLDALRSGPTQPIDERRACRPSIEREPLKRHLARQIQTGTAMKAKLDRANDIYLEFRLADRFRRSHASASTAQLPTLS